MSKPLIVIADTDEKYLATLEYKFLSELDDMVELEIISRKDYFEQFFQSPRTIEILAVCEDLYSGDLQRHNVNHMFVLTENNESGNTEELAVTRIFKYTGIKEIYNELIYRSKAGIGLEQNENKETKVIAVYSAIGGSGKTALSIGLADSLQQNHRKVFYINTESIQEFSVYLKEKNTLTNDGIRSIKNDLTHTYTNIKNYIREEGFSYVPPLNMTLEAYNLDYSLYFNLIQTAKESREFDFIIVDVEMGCSEDKMKILQMADKAIMVCLQDSISINKAEYLLRNIDVRDREKYLFVCNKYDESKENAYLQSQLQKQCTMSEYVEYSESTNMGIAQLAALHGIQRLAYMFI